MERKLVTVAVDGSAEFTTLTAAAAAQDPAQPLHFVLGAGTYYERPFLELADYIITGQWAKKAYTEAQKYGKANKIASSEDKTFSYIPDCSDLPISPDADYVYICENNTIYGTKFKKLPNTKGKTLVADVSSCFLSEPVDVSKYGIIYGGVQKNIGPAGMVISIIREDLITDCLLYTSPSPRD